MTPLYKHNNFFPVSSAIRRVVAKSLENKPVKFNENRWIIDWLIKEKQNFIFNYPPRLMSCNKLYVLGGSFVN